MVTTRFPKRSAWLITCKGCCKKLPWIPRHLHDAHGRPAGAQKDCHECMTGIRMQSYLRREEYKMMCSGLAYRATKLRACGFISELEWWSNQPMRKWDYDYWKSPFQIAGYEPWVVAGPDGKPPKDAPLQSWSGEKHPNHYFNMEKKIEKEEEEVQIAKDAEEIQRAKEAGVYLAGVDRLPGAARSEEERKLRMSYQKIRMDFGRANLNKWYGRLYCQDHIDKWENLRKDLIAAGEDVTWLE